MPLKTGTDRSRDNSESTRALAGKELSPWLLKLMGSRALPLASRPRVHMTMPPLASRIWQQVGHFIEKGNRLVGWVTDYTSLASSQMVRLPTLKPTPLSPVWQRLLDLTWFRRRKGQSELSQTLVATDEGELANAVGEPYPNESPEMLRLTDEEQLFSPADEPYPMVIKSLLSPPTARMELPDTTDDSFQPTYAAPVHPQVKPVTGEPETKDTNKPIAPHIKPIEIPGLHQADKIQRPDRQQVEVQANWQPQCTYQNRWRARVLAPIAQQSVLYRTPITRSYPITRQSIPWAQAIPAWYRPYLTASREEAELSRQAAQQPTPTHLDNIAKVTDIDGETPQSPDNYAWPVDSKIETNLPYSLPDQNKPTLFRTVPERFEQPTILKTTSSFRKPLFNLPTLSKEPILGLLTTKVISQQAPERHQTGWSVPLVNLLPQIVSQRAESKYLPEGSVSMTHSPITIPVVIPGNVGLSQEPSTSPTGTPLTHRERPSVVSFRRQPQPITESNDRTLAIPWQQYLKSVDNTPPPDRSENYDFLWKETENNEPSSPQHKDANQQLELMLTSIVGPKIGPKIINIERSLSTTFGGTAYYESSPVPELALAPVGSSEAVSSPTAKTETQVENTTGEAATPDIDNIARDVYHILKRRIARERERALGLS